MQNKKIDVILSNSNKTDTGTTGKEQETISTVISCSNVYLKMKYKNHCT